MFLKINLLTYLSSIFLVALVMRCDGAEIMIDTQADLDAVLGTSTCETYTNNFLLYCKRGNINGPPLPSTSGFWSSCEDRNCQISIRLRDLGLTEIPASLHIEVTAYTSGPDGDIQVRYIEAPGAPFVVMDTFYMTGIWGTRTYDLISNIEVINLDTEIVLRFASQQPDSHDVFDRIKFITG